jgi:hypothetical protein
MPTYIHKYVLSLAPDNLCVLVLEFVCLGALPPHTPAHAQTNEHMLKYIFYPVPRGSRVHPRKSPGCKSMPGCTHACPDMSRIAQMHVRIPRHGLRSGIHGTSATQTPRWGGGGAAAPQTCDLILKGLCSTSPPKQTSDCPKGNTGFFADGLPIPPDAPLGVPGESPT